MPTISIELFGIEPLEQRLKEMDSVRWAAIVQKQSAEMLNRAREPGGTPVYSGELRNSSRAKGNEMGYGVSYAPHVEYGHRTRNGGYVQGQRFLENNVDTQRPIYKRDLLDAIIGGN